MHCVLGVDEAGRGPLAGPVAVGVVATPERFNLVRAFPGLADSKRLTPLARLTIFKELRAYARTGELAFCVRLSGAGVIDSRGITRAVAAATARGVRALAPDPSDVRVYLDGLLTAPEEYNQQTIIGGDEAVPLISLASIVAKVSRDRLMHQMAKKYPEYGFERHVGYATMEHRQAISRFGLCTIHRRTFCTNALAVE